MAKEEYEPKEKLDDETLQPTIVNIWKLINEFQQ